MTDKIEMICRLCLRNGEDDDYKIIEGTTTEILERLSLKINMAISRFPLICRCCLENLQNSYEFHSTIIDNLTQDISSYSLTANDDHALCLFCVKYIKKVECQLLNRILSQRYVKQFPVLELSSTISTICIPCLESLESYIEFIWGCKSVERTIMKYCEARNLHEGEQIHLSNVILFTSRGMTKDNGDTQPLLEDSGSQIGDGDSKNLGTCKTPTLTNASKQNGIVEAPSGVSVKASSVSATLSSAHLAAELDVLADTLYIHRTPNTWTPDIRRRLKALLPPGCKRWRPTLTTIGGIQFQLRIRVRDLND